MARRATLLSRVAGSEWKPQRVPRPHEPMPGVFITFEIRTYDRIDDGLKLLQPREASSGPYLELQSAGGVRRVRIPRRRLAGSVLIRASIGTSVGVDQDSSYV